MAKFDPITLEILWRRLISIVDEADSTVSRTAFSSLLRDAHDYTCMFTDHQGRELAQGTFATPGQSGAMALGIKNLVKKLPEDGEEYAVLHADVLAEDIGAVDWGGIQEIDFGTFELICQDMAA